MEAKETLAQKVSQMRKQNMSDNQVMQSLQHEGHSAHDILDAFDIADQSTTFAQHANPNPVQNPMKNKPTSVAPPPMQQNNNDEEIEELIEAIIDEKWANLEKDVNKVLEWKDTLEEGLKTLHARMDAVEKDFDSLHKALVGKIGDYDKNILEVGSQLKAMEQVFSKVLPTFTENVQELSRVTDKIKRQ